MKTEGHILSDFDASLGAFKEKTIAIGSLSHQNLSHAIQGIFERNLSLCNQVIADDEEIDRLEIEIDEDGVILMSKFRPFAADLRAVVSSMKISSNLERVADYAVSIAKRGRKLIKNEEIGEVRLIEPLHEYVSKMLMDSLTAYADGDNKLAEEIILKERELKKLHKNVSNQVTKCLEDEEKNRHYKSYIDLIFICRWLDAVGNLAINLAEDVIYIETATDVRHGGLK